MSSDADWQRIKEIVDEALEMLGNERSDFIERACDGDQELQKEVESLLGFDADDDFLETPVLAAGANGESQDKSAGLLDPGTRLGPYEIRTLIGAGGMGQVYKAVDSRLDRVVAIKTLPDRFAADESLRKRFEREARAISRLNHPHICTLHDIGHQDGIDYLVMEYIEGETLADVLKREPMALADALVCARQVAEGLELAHDAGIIHRDLKPSNVMLSASGVKLLDFGLAKRSQADALPDPAVALDGREKLPAGNATALTQMTRHGTIMGTAPYMSPEQIEGKAVDALADQFSFGAMFYEMLTGLRPFRGESTFAVIEAILGDDVQSPRQLRTEIPADVEALVLRCLARDPAARFASTAELTTALREAEARHAGLAGLRVSKRTAAAALFGLIAVGLLAAGYWYYDDAIRWIEQDTLAEVDALTEAGDLAKAYALLYPLAERLPRDAAIAERLDRISLPIVINTQPPGAAVKFRPYSTNDSWIDVGETPLVGQRIPYAMMDWRIEKAGYAPFDGAPFGIASFTVFAMGYPLVPEAEQPPGMVKIPGGNYQRLRFPLVQLDDYWLDQYEVSNEQFAEFVADGGYRRPEFWRQGLTDKNGAVEFTDAMARFVDQGGQPGPAGWLNGSYASDAADMPVRGVSWFEASAYCAYRDKALPTLHHWSAANRQEQLSDIIRVSNFGTGPEPVGRQRGLGDFGTYDMAGNVREWVHNASATGRYILGGAWSDPSYAFNFDADSADPWSRAETNGFRCARYTRPVDTALTGPLILDDGLAKPDPVNDELFTAYSRIFRYDAKPLDSRVEETREEDTWRYELVSFDAAYGGERVLAHVFLPKDVKPPFQAVVWFPGNDAFMFGEEGPLASPYLFDFLPQQGRALIYPVYKGTYQRSVQTALPAGPNEMRDMLAIWSKDLGRTLDYLEERDDIDAGRIAYYGFSVGAVQGPIFTAVEDRFSGSILLGGGLLELFPADTSLANFAPRSMVPTLMINGRDDFIMPFETAQLGLFELIGTPAADKRHVRLDGGHIPPDRQAIIDEIDAWLNQYLGPVARLGNQ